MSDDVGSSDRLLGLAEVAELLQVSRQTVVNWRSRRTGFPAPVADLRSGPIWNEGEILDWARDNDVAVASAIEPVAARAGTTIALMNMKGGVGKSTLAANLGWYCAYHENMRVLLVDLDPQFNLSQYVMGTSGYEKHLGAKKGTVLNVFEHGTPRGGSPGKRTELDPRSVISTVKAWRDGSRIDLVPAELNLSWTLKNPTTKEQLLKNFLSEVRGEYDAVFIDCAPTESILTTATYLATDHVLVPVKPEFLSVIGLPLLVRSLEDFEHDYQRTVNVLGIVFNASADKSEHDRSRAQVRQVAKANGWDVFKSEIAQSDSYPKGARLGKPIFLTDYARAYKVSNFMAVAEEFMKKLLAA
jgi:chromosome partitioning protein